MRAIFYGKLADRLDRAVELEGPATIGEARTLLAHRFPHAREELLATSLKACVGDVIVGDEHPVSAADTIEFFPPVSGG